MIKQRPIITSDWWSICEMPNLLELEGSDPRQQHIVDHGFIQAENGKWVLWACMRGTKVGRLIYGWAGDSLEKGPWPALGVRIRAQAEFGERIDPETVGAPFFAKFNDVYYCFYHSSGAVCAMTSKDGINYQRKLNDQGTSVLIPNCGRDAMITKFGTHYFAYSTVSTVGRDGWGRSFVIVRTSKDLQRWSDYTIVSEGGMGGNGVVSAESPFVVEVEGYFYLFRASSIDFHTYVYRSDNPFDFGVQNDHKLIARFPIKAPEIIHYQGQYYISDLADFQGIKLAKLDWDSDTRGAFAWQELMST